MIGGVFGASMKHDLPCLPRAAAFVGPFLGGNCVELSKKAARVRERVHALLELRYRHWRRLGVKRQPRQETVPARNKKKSQDFNEVRSRRRIANKKRDGENAKVLV